MADSDLGFDTLKVRGEYDPNNHNHAVSVPIYRTASFDLENTERAERMYRFKEFGYLYSRVRNPTVTVLEERVAALDGGTARTTPSELLPHEQAAAGIPPETVRLSVGLEDPHDLIADLEQAFAVSRAAETSQ